MEYTRRETLIVELACCVSSFVTPLLSTMMNLSLVNIGMEFGVGSHDLAYVNTAFLLTSVIFMVPLVKLADIIGKKKMYYIGLLVIIAGCVAASMSQDFWFVILCRAVIGIGGAGLMGISISILMDVVPGRNRGLVLGLQAMCVYIGLSVGPAVGGFVNDLMGWRVLFLIVVPVAVLSVLLMLGARGDVAPDSGKRFDLLGSVIYGLAILFSMVGVINLPETWAIVSIVVGVAFLVWFVRQQTNNPNYLLQMKLFKIKVFSGSCIATFMSYAASYSVSFFLPLYLQSIGQCTASEAGILMMTQPVIQAIGTPLCGRLSDRMSRKAILPTLGMSLIAVCALMLVFLSIDTPLYIVIVAMAFAGFGFALFSAPNTTLIMSSVPRKHASEASGMVSVMRQTGMLVSMGVAMMIISLIMGSTDNLSPATYGEFLEVIRISFIVCFIMCVIGTITSAFRENPEYID